MSGADTRDRPLAPGDPVLVIGGTGPIGRALAAVLAREGLRPLLVSRHRPESSAMPPGAEHLTTSSDRLPSMLAGAKALLGEGPLGVVEVLEEGPEAIAPLLDALARRAYRLVFIGSASAFGVTARGHRHGENEPPTPDTPSMEEKVAVERLLSRQHALGRAATTLRCAYPYGLGQGPLTPIGQDRDLFGKIERGDDIEWTPAGALPPLQPLWAGDIAEAIHALLTRPERPRPLYHIAGPQVLEWEDYLHVIAGTRGVPRLRRRPVEELLERHPDAWFLRLFLPRAPLLDDSLLRDEVYAPMTRLADVVDAWAAWCASGDP